MSDDTTPGITLPPSFHFAPQDRRLKKPVPNQPDGDVDAPLGVLENFKGTFVGTGLNLIFRPFQGNPPDENILEINLTSETLAFAKPLGNVPNRGLEQQPDIFLNGVPYVQTVNDVTNIETGKGDKTPASGIHFEPGLWMHIPATTVDPVLGESLTRMASIPHGTTINAQTLEPSAGAPGPPPFTGPNALPKVDITPFPIGSPNNRLVGVFKNQTAATPSPQRIPPDLTTFIAAGTITQDILDNPNIVLANAIAGQTITNTIVFTVSTSPKAPFLSGGTANIDFLQGNSVGAQSGPNASAVDMSATFWIETVQAEVQIPVMKKGDPDKKVQIPAPSPTGQPGPFVIIHPPHDITAPATAKVSYTQIQYMQTVNLNFAGLTWPHVSCATLIPNHPIRVQNSAFPK